MVAAAGLVAVAAASLGCRGAGFGGLGGFGEAGGSLTSRSLSVDAAVLDAEFTTAVYAHEPGGDTVFVLADRPLEELIASGLERGQLVVLDLLWPPRAGSTPISAEATNLSVRHLVVVDGEAGTYAGAGFAMPSGELGEGPVRLRIWDSTVRLAGATDGFRDVLSPARLTGTLTAVEDEATVRRVVAWLQVAGPDSAVGTASAVASN